MQLSLRYQSLDLACRGGLTASVFAGPDAETVRASAR